MGKHEVSLNWAEDMAFDVDVNGHTLRLDAEDAAGGRDTGPRPKPLMLAALAGCTAMDVISLLRKMRVEFDDLKIKIDADLTDDHPKVYTAIRVVYQVYGSQVDHEKMQKAVELSQDKYCGVSAMLRSFAKVSWEIEYLS